MVVSRMTRYIMLARSQRNYWIPLRFQPPILLHPMLGKNDSFSNYNMSHEDQKWDRLKQNHGYFNYKINEPGQKITNDLRMRMRIRNL